MTGPRQKLAAAFYQAVHDKLTRRPISEAPEEGRLSVVDNGTVDRYGDRRACATFKGGKWCRANGQPLPFEPTIWMDWQR